MYVQFAEVFLDLILFHQEYIFPALDSPLVSKPWDS